MGELTIHLKNAKLVEALEEMASVHGKSVEAEVHALIEGAVADHGRRQEVVQRAKQIRAMTPKGVKQTDSVEIIRQMREERSRELGG